MRTGTDASLAAVLSVKIALRLAAYGASHTMLVGHVGDLFKQAKTLDDYDKTWADFLKMKPGDLSAYIRKHGLKTHSLK